MGSIVFFTRSAISISAFRKGRFGTIGLLKSKLAGSSKALSIAGINIPVLAYQFIRFTVLIAWLSLIVILKIKVGLPSFGLQLFLLIILLVASTPRLKIGGIKLPFLFISSFFDRLKKEAANMEIYRAISQLINLFTIKGEKILGSNYVLGEIIKNVKVTKPVYLKMLSMWNMNRQKEAADYFADVIGTKEARDLAGVFLKLDLISPRELRGQLAHYQNNIRVERTTARERINERNGNIIYILAIVSAVVVLLNFLVVVLTDVFTSYNLLSF